MNTRTARAAFAAAIFFALCLAALSACSPGPKATLETDATTDSSLSITAENGVSGSTANSLAIEETEEIAIESDIASGFITVKISDEDGAVIFEEELSGKRTAQVEPTSGNGLYTVNVTAENATGTVLIEAVVPEHGAFPDDNPTDTTANTNSGFGSGLMGNITDLGTSISGGPDTTDELFSRYSPDTVFYVFGFDGEALSASDYEPVEVDGVEDGHFYKVTGDIEILNGGVAGYMNHPEVKEVHFIEEISPDELNRPDITGNSQYGLLRIGDYADGDYLLFDYAKGVWKDGAWIYRYRDTVDLDDGRKALVSDEKKISKEQIRQGADAGVLSCPDYFVLPPK